MLSLIVFKKGFIDKIVIIVVTLLMALTGCTRDLSQYSSSIRSSTSSEGLQDDEEIPPEENDSYSDDYMDSDISWYSFSGVGIDKISWTEDGEHAAVVYHQLVQLLDLNNEPDGEIPFPEGYEEEYAVGERGVFFYGRQTPREKAYPSKCLWKTQKGNLFVAGIAIMEYDGEVVKEVPAVEVRGGENGQAETYWFEGTRVLPVETYEESWKWVDSKTLLLTTVQTAPDDPKLTCKYYYRYYPNTDKIKLIVSGNSFVTVHTNQHGIFYDSYHTTKEWGSIVLADESGTRKILDGERFSAYAVSDDIIAMLRWAESGNNSLWYADMEDLKPRKITGIDDYARNMDRWGSLDGIFGTYIPLGMDEYYDVSTGDVVEIPPEQRMDMVNPQGTHWIQHDDAEEIYRIVPVP